MSKHTYTTTCHVTVEVDSEAETVLVDVDLIQLADDITFGHPAEYAEEDVQNDSDLIRELQSHSLANHRITHDFN